MSLLSKLKKSEIRKPEIPNAEIPTPEKTAAPTDPCPVCDCPYWWRDIYAGPAGPWRCFACCTPPHESFVSDFEDTRRNAASESVDDEERDFDLEWVSFTLVDQRGQAWDVTTRRDERRGTCPPSLAISDWLEILDA